MTIITGKPENMVMGISATPLMMKMVMMIKVKRKRIVKAMATVLKETVINTTKPMRNMLLPVPFQIFPSQTGMHPP